MKKKLLVIIMAATLVLAGCGAKKSLDNPDAAAGAEISATTESTAVSEADTKSEVKEAANSAKDQKSETDVATAKSTEATAEQTKADKDASTSAASSEQNKAKEAASASSEKTKAEDTPPAPSASAETTQADQASAPAPEPTPAPEPAPEPEPALEPAPAPQTVDYGRIVYTGDSRSVDMFNGGVDEIWYGSYNGITVFCKDACQQDYMINAVNNVGWENFDTLVSWMGCNNYGDFGPYAEFYSYVLSQGKNLILCTVGPTLDSALANDFDKTHYTNDLQIAYNNSLWSWANANGVKVIDLYSYINSNPDIYLDPADGIHYQPQPTTVIWNVILSGLN
ncbi:MAG: hypothetical protein K6F75_12950 [Butyrivibrio sp.]|nr:hypothetical protein [Butyrivibrio sp.]